jgi:tRNA (guanine-N7-)-methyltransferase
VIGAYEFLEDYVAPQSAAEIHLYHPQPFREKRKELAARRLVSPAFLALVHRSLPEGGQFVIQTDNQPYWSYIRRIAPEFFVLQEHPGRWPDTPQGRTRREIYAIQHSMPVYRAVAQPRRDLTPEHVAGLVAKLPLPRFDAGK